MPAWLTINAFYLLLDEVFCMRELYFAAYPIRTEIKRPPSTYHTYDVITSVALVVCLCTERRRKVPIGGDITENGWTCDEGPAILHAHARRLGTTTTAAVQVCTSSSRFMSLARHTGWLLANGRITTRKGQPPWDDKRSLATGLTQLWLV